MIQSIISYLSSNPDVMNGIVTILVAILTGENIREHRAKGKKKDDYIKTVEKINRQVAQIRKDILSISDRKLDKDSEDKDS